jgi:hypothetical protein
MAKPTDEQVNLLPNDIDAYAHSVEGIDPARYFDSQAQDVWLAALRRWPLLASVLHPEADHPDGHG